MGEQRPTQPLDVKQQLLRASSIVPGDNVADGKAAESNTVAEFRLTLRFGECQRAVVIRAPTEPLEQTALLPILQAFDNEVVALAEEETARQGKEISCRAGCGACCRQFVPIAPLEARRLAALVASMDEGRRVEIQRRFTAALTELERRGLLTRLATACEIPDEAARGEFGLAYFHVGVACPFLEDESCSIYAERPLACREFLVTSPAENCRDPGPDNIKRVALPGQLSETLYRFGPQGERQAARWMPLVLALQYAAAVADTPPPRQSGDEFVGKFLDQLTQPSKARQPTQRPPTGQTPGPAHTLGKMS